MRYSHQMKQQLQSRLGSTNAGEQMADTMADLSRGEMYASFGGLAAAATPLIYQATPWGPKQGWGWAAVTGVGLGLLTRYVVLRFFAQEALDNTLRQF